MAPTLANRQTVREALGTLLSAALVGTGKVAQFGYSYKKANLGGESPGYALASAGSNRTLAQPSYTDVFIVIHLFSLYMTVNESTGAAVWSEQSSENSLDAIEKGASEILIDYARHNETSHTPWAQPWEQMDVVDRSVPDEVFVEGWLYRHEEITVKCHCPNPA